ncbi:MAG: LytTR family transcriptional regulator [Bacteroidales bacterium]|nr:LytTR family transcriptional regulator [Bacteroidales bacterium]MBQ9702599.1 LytTR family transcriptional regulator [Bacteroidales bacterium]MBR1782440.1 LytTR family transcriptional regulator [Bacteroidales bacterium]
MDALRKKEMGLYAGVWMVLFALSFVSGFPSWKSLLPYFVLFALHEILAVPFLTRKQVLPYLALTLTFVAAFAVYCFFGEAHSLPPHGFDGPFPPGGEEDFRPEDDFRPMKPEVMRVIVGVLMLLVNLGVRAMFKSKKSAQETVPVPLPAPAPEEPREEVLHFKSDYRTVPVRPEEIVYVESMSEYIKIHREGDAAPLVVLYSLKHLMEQLPAQQFMRIHRSYIISLAHIREASRTSVTLSDGTSLPVGEMYRPAFREYLQDFSA